MTEETERARREKARREVNLIVRDTFGRYPWFSKLVAALFMESAQCVAGASLDIEPRELGKFVSECFGDVLGEFATFDGLSRGAQYSGPTSPTQGMPSMVAAAATPDLGSFAAETLGDFDDEEYPADLPPMSDDEAETMGFLPEA